MQTNHVYGAIIAAMFLAGGAVSLCISMLGGTSGRTTGGWSMKVSTEMVKGFTIQTTNVELTAIEKEARAHTLEDQQKFLEKYADVAAINVEMVDTMPAASAQLFGSEKSPEMLEINCRLNQLSGVYEDCEAAYREDKGVTFVDGPVNDFTTNYANAKNGLDDEKYMKVASAKSRVDLMLFYMRTCHIVDVCTYKEDKQNNKTVAEHPVLFMPSEAHCSKATQAKAEFEMGPGATLLQERDPECAAAMPEPLLTAGVTPEQLAVGTAAGVPLTADAACFLAYTEVPDDQALFTSAGQGSRCDDAARGAFGAGAADWYRLPPGRGLPTAPPGDMHCGTMGTGWLSGWPGAAGTTPTEKYAVPADRSLPPAVGLPPADGAVCFDIGAGYHCYTSAAVRAVGCGAFDLWALPTIPDCSPNYAYCLAA